MKTTSILLAVSMLVGCSGVDFDVGATRGDTGEDNAEATSDDTGAVTADAGLDSPDGSVDSGKPPLDTGLASDTDVGVDTGIDIGSPDTAVTPPDSDTDVLCPDLDGDGQTDARCGGNDCHDGNKDVFLGQTAVFSSPYTTLSGGSSWDYNCNGKNDLWVSSLVTCTGSCSLTATTWVDTVPPCGATGKWLSTCTGACVVTTTTKKQFCN